MPYLPKSKISTKRTTGGILIYKGSLLDFSGSYIATADGKFFEGSNYAEKGPELILKPSAISSPSQNFFNADKIVKKYNLQNSKIKHHLKSKKSIPVVKSKPSEKDYKRGWYTRYFSGRINGTAYLEIDRDTYESLKNKTGDYDYNLYACDSIKWFLTGNVFKKNSISIKQKLQQYKNIYYLFPVINEFSRPILEIITNLSTLGGELYYGDSTEYIGKYHLHPLMGPMVGNDHSDEYEHAPLYYLNQLPNIPNLSYEDFLNNYDKMECYRCITINNTLQVVGNRRSRLLGCPAHSHNTYEAAAMACGLGPDPSDPQARLGNPTSPLILDRRTPINGGFPNNPNSNNIYPPLNYSNFSTLGDSETSGNTSGVTIYGNCFTPNTLITMADFTQKIIANIEKGDKVKSEKGESTVLDIQIHEGDFDVYSINGKKPFVTEEHPFKTIDGWKAIDPLTTIEKHQQYSTTLNLKDIIYKIKGKEMVKSIEKGKTTYPKVYNLVLDNEHVYFANGYLVHNEKLLGSAAVANPADAPSSPMGG